MNSILKKPYEISLWDEKIYWHRRRLIEAEGVTDKNYQPGKFYSQDNNALGNSPYVLDNNPYDSKKAYYSLMPKTEGNYVEGPRAEDTNVDATWELSTLFQFYKERKLCVIGSNIMTAPIRAIQPKFNKKVSGEKTLTFTVYSQYWDEETERLIWNPFMKYLTNERKVKLYYENKWYDFVIKNINEDSATKAFTYTCKDLFLNELSKTGFELEFDSELGNNMGTLPELAEEVLAGSDWVLKNDNLIVKQFVEEPVYRFDFAKTEGVKMYKMAFEEGKFEPEETLPSTGHFYAFYSQVKDEPTEEPGIFQFLYDPYQSYSKDDKNVIIGYSEDSPKGIFNYYVENVVWEEKVINEKKVVVPVLGEQYLTTGPAELASEYRGERLVKTPITHFEPKLGKVLTHYTSDPLQTEADIYGFTSTKYVSPTIVQNFIVNSSNFTNTVGWNPGKLLSQTGERPEQKFPVVTADTFPTLRQAIETGFVSEEDFKPSLYLTFTPDIQTKTKTETVYRLQTLMNMGINANKTSIKRFQQGEQYIFYLDIYKENGEELTSANIIGANGIGDFHISVKEYESIDDGFYKFAQQEGVDKQLFTFYSLDNENSPIKRDGGVLSEIEDPDGLYKDGKVIVGVCNESITEEQLLNKDIGIFISAAKKLYIKEMKFFKKETVFLNEGTDQETEILIIPEAKPKATVKTVYNYFKKDAKYTDLKDLGLLYQDYVTSDTYRPIYGAGEHAYEKVRSITAKESNRFNLLQSLCETFQCWCKFEIEHESNGEIGLDENYRQKKFVSFHEYIGKQNYVGFKYGINLKSIKRTLDSTGIISKIIVKNNSNEFASNGFCSIARARDNVTGENSIYNFDYYVGQKLIDFSTLNNDLYLQPNVNGYLGYYRALRPINNEIQQIIELRAEILGDIAKYTSEHKTYDLSYNAAQEDLIEQERAFEGLTGKSYRDFQKQNGELTDNEKAWLDDQRVVAIMTAIAKDISIKNSHGPLRDKYYKILTEAENARDQYDTQLKELRAKKLAINHQFYKKYSRFIQEGSWISEDYIDDDLYYIDALSTLYTSSRPKVSYTIDVIEMSALPDYEAYIFDIGDKTYVEDKEFFGWAYDGSNRLYREEVIVNEVTFELDSPEKNVIKVQNYKTQFEDLFQRVVATSQQVQFSTGEYRRSAAIVQPGGIISADALQNSFLNNAFTLENAKDQSVVIGDDGLTTTNLFRPNEMLRLVAGGIFLSKDGGATWTTGISASGINASSLTTGTLNAARVNITMGAEVAFRWDELGISSYKHDQTGISPGVFTRFDQYGIYGINNKGAFEIPKEYTRETALEYLKENADFGLTWGGFWLKSNGADGYVSISSDRDFEVIRKNNGQKTTIIQIGRLSDNNGDYYGIRINDLSGKSVLETNGLGELWLKNILQVQTTDTNMVRIGLMNSSDADIKDYHRDNVTGSQFYKIIDANGVFKVYEDGHVVGTSAHFSGGSTFQGTITATGGTIGGLDIEEWTNLGYSLQVFSSEGVVFKNATTTTLTAKFYKGSSLVEGDTVIEKTAEGEEKEYYVRYLWSSTPDVTDSWVEGAGNTLEVDLNKVANNITYTCKVELVPKEN